MVRDWAQHDGITTGLILVAVALMSIGIVMVASVTVDLDRSLFESVSWSTPVVRQALFAVAAVLIMLIGARIGPGPLRWRDGSLFQPAVLWFLIAVVLLIAVWLPGIGVESHGRRRWVAFGPLGFQPSEVAKLALVVFLAAVLTRKEHGLAATRMGSLPLKPDLTIPMLAIGLICALVGREDFGTAVLLATVGGLMVVVRGCPLATLAAWTVPTIAAFSYLLVSQPYRVRRLLSFLTIWDDPQGSGYHPIQSLAAIASGGWTGCGLGAGLAKYGYLPEARTDFIFAIICEEIGLLGGVLVILLFVTFVFLGLRTIQRAPTTDGGFARMFAFGVTITVALQALMNIAVVTVVAPTKGIGLPLVSAGGTSVLCFSLAIGLLAGAPRLRVVQPTGQALQSEGLGCVRPGLLTAGEA